MPTVLVTSGSFLVGAAAGFTIGAGALSAVFAILDAHRRQMRRLVLGFAARALVDALTALVEDGDLPYRLMYQGGSARDLAAAVAKVAEE